MEDEKTLVMVTGPKRSGKDTLFRHVFEPLGYQRVALAGCVKQCAAKLALDVWSITLTEEMLEGRDGYDREESVEGGHTLAGRPLSVRWLLQWVGTNLIRDQVSDRVWIDALLNRSDLGPSVCITDLRYINEASILRRELEARGYRVFVISLTGSVGASDTHSSECGYKEIEAQVKIENNGTIEDLVRSGCRALVTLGLRGAKGATGRAGE